MEYKYYDLSNEARELLTLKTRDVKNLSLLRWYNFDERYVADKDGNVYLVKSSNPTFTYATKMSPFETRNGYIEYVLTDKNYGKKDEETGRIIGKKHIQAHRITAGLFLKHIEGKNYVNHKDGNKHNNSVNNLEYVNHSENIKHTYDVLGRKPWNKKY